MHEIIWFFPILFIFHDMEEIIGFHPWLKKNELYLVTKYPKIKKLIQSYSTEGMAVAVMEELILCLLICFLTRLSGCYGFWLGGFIAYAVHLLIHMLQSIILKKYIPALTTSIICLPISLSIILWSIHKLNYSFMTILLYAIIGFILVASNIKFAHLMMKKVTMRLYP